MADSPLVDDSFRLPRTVLPSRYELTVAPDLEHATFSGRARIEVDVLEATTTIVCNAVELEIDTATLAPSPRAGAQTELDTTSARVELEIAFEHVAERVTFRAPGEIAPGAYLLECRFAGTLNDKLRGFYRSTYLDADGRLQAIATTQFEPTDARRAFPCWDEPDKKAVFEIALEVDQGLLAISNGAERARTALPGGKSRIEFTETIPMSTYLVAFVVGALEATEPIDASGVPLRVVHVPGKGHLTSYALDVGAHALSWFADYFDQAYPGDKLDLVGIPDFASGAMENLGCVTFREAGLLADPKLSSTSELEYIASVIEHEIAHMWFGDLVTMSWWNGIWLNEAFATYMSLCCLDDFRPELHCWVGFGRDRDAALSLDGLHSTRPIEYEVRTSAEADAMFDMLTYEKGGSLLRMLELYLGTETFRSGVRRYLATHRLSNTETGDLWDSLELAAPGEPIRALMDSWIFQGGHPIVTAAADGSKVVISQQPFSYLPAGERPKGAPPSAIGSDWLVPVAIEPMSSRDHHEPKGREHLLLGAEPLPVGEAPVVVNAGGSGVYRVRYDETLFGAVSAGLSSLEPLERFTFVADQWACTLAGLEPISRWLRIVEGLSKEREASIWALVAGTLSLIDLAARDEDREALAAFVRSVLGPELERSGWDATALDDDDAPRRRNALVAALGTIGADEAVREECERRFAAVETGTPLPPDLASAILKVVASRATRDRYDRLVSRFASASDPLEEQRYLDSLAHVQDLDLVRESCESCLTSVRSQDAPYLLRAMLTNRVAGPTTFGFLVDRWGEIVGRFPENSITRLLSGLSRLAHLSPDGTATYADSVESFANANAPEGHQLTVDQHMERLHVNVRFVKVVRPALGLGLGLGGK